MRHVFLCLLTPSSDIWVSVRFPSSFFLLPSSFFLPSSFSLVSSFLPSFLPSFLLTETHHKQCAAQRVTCVSKSAHVRAQPCLKFSVVPAATKRGICKPPAHAVVRLLSCQPAPTVHVGASRCGCFLFSGSTLRGGLVSVAGSSGSRIASSWNGGSGDSGVISTRLLQGAG